MNKRLVFIMATVIVMAAGTALAASTLDNLQAAYNGESNANARYLAFADKANSEGYRGVAVLFRAAAKAEEIHAANHAVVIKELGGEPKANIEKPDVKTTKENIQAAIKGETYERDTMYPEFIKQARAEKQNGALRTFNYALAAETEHARLYTKAAKNQKNMMDPTTMYVCSVCGYTTTKIDFQKCPGCLNPKEKYMAVS